MYRFLFFLFFSTTLYAESEFFGDIKLESRFFYKDGRVNDDQQHFYESIAAVPSFVYDWNEGQDVFTAKVFGRYNSIDQNRSHYDMRQFDWVKSLEEWEIRLGVSKVFWGVTESVHLVDIINQTDLVENFDGEQKLGQPMLNIAWVKGFGIFSAYVLPYFRERTFPGDKGRLLFGIPFSENAEYESSQRERHIDYAARWSHSIDIFDIGLSYFRGTSRDPRFVVVSEHGRSVFLPSYDQIYQWGLDLQVTKGAWLIKWESIYRDWNPDAYFAFAGGFEYTFSNIQESGMDLGLLMEYLRDTRNEQALTPFENDLFTGARLAMNDENDLQVLGGVIWSMRHPSKFLNLELSRLIGQNFKVTVESRAFLDVKESDAFVSPFKDESYTQFELMYSF